MLRSIFCTLLFTTSMLSGCLTTLEPTGSACESSSIITDAHERFTVLTYDISGFNDAFYTQFSEIHGIEVEVIKVNDAGGILELMLQTQIAPQADVVIGLDNTYLQTAIRFCLLQSHNLDNVTLIPSALESYQGPLASPFDQGDVCLNVDERYLSQHSISSPSSLWELTQDEWHGQVAIPSPLTSSPGRAFMVATIDYFEHDEDTTTDAFDWWKAMSDNGAIFTTGWTEAYELHYTGGYGQWVEGHRGDASITVSYCHSPGVEAYFGGNSTDSTSIVLPRSTFHQVEYAAITNGATHPDLAKSFIEYILEPEVNLLMPELNYMASVLPEGSWPESNGYGYHVDEPLQNANISIERIDQEMESWLTQWIVATS